jgi:molybdopterin-guanine dinucleotide biosynthesis protein A
MGTDKGLLVYHGKPQREIMFDLLSRYCEEVFTSCRPEQNIPSALNPLPDVAGVGGPLNGIMTALAHRRVAWLVVAIDMPFVDGTAIEALIKERDTSRIATCFYNKETGRPEPLLALWEPPAYELLQEYVRDGGFSPRQFLSRQTVKMIDPPHERLLVNVNHPGFKF